MGFAPICFHAISKRYLEQTSSHLIRKLKSFVVARMSFVKHAKKPSSGQVEAAWYDLEDGIKCFDSEALTALELVLRLQLRPELNSSIFLLSLQIVSNVL